MIASLVQQTLVGLGIDIIDLGLSTTPTVEIAVPMEAAQGGIILTASHNPKQWNALKLLNAKGEFISGAEGEALMQIAADEAFKFADDLFLKSLGRVANGGDLKSKKVLAAIDEYKQHVAETQKHRSRIDDKIKLFERLKTFFASYRLKEITTATLAELTDWMRENSRTKTLSPNSIKRYQAEIRLFLNWCVERGYLEQAPKLPKQKFVVNRRPKPSPVPRPSDAHLDPRRRRIHAWARAWRRPLAPAERPIDIMDAIALGGGFSPRADKDKIILRRKGQVTTYSKKQLDKLYEQGQRVMIEPDDTLEVRESIL
jgi:uncharacterized protein YbgA (DUF1722 family)